MGIELIHSLTHSLPYSPSFVLDWRSLTVESSSWIAWEHHYLSKKRCSCQELQSKSSSVSIPGFSGLYPINLFRHCRFPIDDVWPSALFRRVTNIISNTSLSLSLFTASYHSQGNILFEFPHFWSSYPYLYLRCISSPINYIFHQSSTHIWY